MSTTTTAHAKLLSAFAKRASNPTATLTLAEEAAIAEFLPGHAGGFGPGPGLPAGPAGDARGTNEMRRTNWFNGRFLTAEALRRQDAYFDLRGRLDAHLLMPGVAYGLGLSANGLNTMPVIEDRRTPPTQGGFDQRQTITLSPGLAFDHVGRPILVSQPFDFRLEQLIAVSRQTPRRVAPGGIDFAPCVCLVPDPAGPTGGAPAVRPGCYLLIIEPGEVPEGEAKVYGEACVGTATSITCQSESWRGSFGLSLVRVPLELPEEEGLNTAWALRGTISAWWFDVFEHSLIKRWDPAFATDGGFAAPAGPGRHEAGAVALAMLWLGTDGSAIFLDRWIPRRSIVATPGEDWHRTRFGAPPRAAAWARIHQFQAMLAEHLARAPLMGGGNVPARMNLWQRGFRHIPPIGFLPLDPAAIGAHQDGNLSTTGNAVLDRIITAAGGRIQLVSNLIAGAKAQAFGYFRDTTVMPYCVVALHDDDIFEDLSNVYDKDPIQVARRLPRQAPPVPQPPPAPVPGVAGPNPPPQNPQAIGTPSQPASAGWIETLGRIFDDLGLDELVNRRTEIVKVIIPLQGLTRSHPVVGVVPEDARPQAAEWLGAELPTWWTNAAMVMDARAMAQLAQRMPLEILPRHFAVYVKQRLVLLDILVMLIEILQSILVLARDVQRVAVLPQQPTEGLRFPTTTIARAYQQQPAEKRAIAEAAFAEPLVRDAIARAAVLATPDLQIPARNAQFAAKLHETEGQLEDQKEALARVSDAFAAEYPGFQVMQVIAAVQPPTQAKATFEAISAAAVRQPLRNTATGALVEATVADTVVNKEGPVIFASPAAASIYATMNEAVAGKDARAYLADAPAGVTVQDVLEKVPAEAAQLLGGQAKLRSFTQAVAKDKAAAVAAARTLTEAPPPRDVVQKLTAAIAGGQDAGAAVEMVRRDVGTDQPKRAFLDAAGTMIRTLGAERALRIAGLAGQRTGG